MTWSSGILLPRNKNESEPPLGNSSVAAFLHMLSPLLSFLRGREEVGVGMGVGVGVGVGMGVEGVNGSEEVFLQDLEWSVEDAFVEGSHLWWLLVAGYCFVFTVGVIGNAVLLAALCGSGSRARALPVRNHLMVNLAAADLLVTAVCVPISACAAASHACWPSFLVAWMCELGPLLQRTPVAASTLSLALLSLDRWAALRHPRFAQRFRDKRFVLMSMGVIWVLASVVSAPTFWARHWDTNNNVPIPPPPHNTTLHLHMDEKNNTSLNWSWSFSNTTWSEFHSPSSSSAPSSWQSWESWGWTGHCTEQWTNAGIQLAYAATYLGTAFVSPALIVAACHASVSQKLTAQLQVLSGASAQDKTRPRPKQVIIVARELPTNHNHNGTRTNFHPSNEDKGQSQPPSKDTNGHGPTLLVPPHPNDHPSPNNSKFSRKVIPCDPNSDDDDIFLRMQIQADLESFRQLSQLQQNHHQTKSKGTATKGGGFITSMRSFNRSLKRRRESAGEGDAKEEMEGERKLGGGEVESSTDKSCEDALNALNAVCANHPLKAARRETSIIRAHRRLRKKLSNPLRPPPPLLPTYSSQSFRSRRRAANLLAALAAVFVLCWAPYVLCALWDLFAKDKSIVRLLIPFALFLGHAHSAINPVVSWRLNRSAFVRFQRQPFRSLLPDWSLLSWCRAWTCPCCPCCCCCCCGDCDNSLSPSTPRRPQVKYPPNRGTTGHWVRRRCCCCSQNSCPTFRRQMRRSSSPEGWNRNSSTNEAALGAFHPKYLSRLPAPDPISKCHTSHFLR